MPFHLRPSLPLSLPLLLILLLFPLSLATPLHHADPAPEAAWAAHLHADRFTLIPGPTWTTDGHVQPVSPINNHSRPFSIHKTTTTSTTTTTKATSTSQPPLHLPHQSARTTVFPAVEGEGFNSKVEFHVHNVPASFNKDPAIKKCQAIVQEAWTSSVTVKARIVFSDIGGENVLARGGGTYFVKLPDLFDTILPVAAAESIRGRDLNENEKDDGKYDILITMNSNTPWYDGTDGSPPQDKYDFVTVCLHEFYHNFVFAGSIVAKVNQDPNSPQGVHQEAFLHKNYRTRFDSFLANKDNCAVLNYLTDTQLAQAEQVTNNQLLAGACTNNELWFTHDSTKIARIFAPRVFKVRSSVYHLDPNHSDKESKLMFPTITKGEGVHTVSTTIRNIQAATLREDWNGANTRCARLASPIIGTQVNDSDFHEENVWHDNTEPVPREVFEDNVRRIGGLPVWGFVLLIIFAILLALLLLGLCLALLLRRKRKRGTIFSSSRSTSKYPTTHSSRSDTGTSSRSSGLKSYIPGVGGTASSARTHSYSRSHSHSESRHTSSKHPTSKHTTSKSSSKHTRTKSETDVGSRKEVVCPSSGKYIYKCKCKCCCKESVTRPPPVASVHTFDPDSVPSASHKHTHSHKHSHKHSAVKSLKKSCKSKSLRSCHHGCHCCYCCKYKPASSKSSSKCTKSVAPSSTKCESVCKSCKSYSCRCESVCKSCNSSSCKCSSVCKSCKSTSCKCSSVCKSCKSSSCRCSSVCRSCKSSSCRCDSICKSSTRCESMCKTSTKASSSRAPPSTKPPSTKPPSTKPPSSCKPSSTSCKPSSSSAKTCCKSAASGAACQPTCRRVVEININRC